MPVARLTDEAVQDVVNALDYVADSSVEAADQLLATLESSYARLASWPNLGE